jgi:hypothetical protein
MDFHNETFLQLKYTNKIWLFKFFRNFHTDFLVAALIYIPTNSI